MIRVLLADDQALVRAGFRMILDAREDIEVVGEAASGREAIELAKATLPDVVLMDIRMPDVDGLEATRVLLQAGVPTRVLILTTFDLDELLSPSITRRLIEEFVKRPPRRAGTPDPSGP